jgi:hypothetical protein
MRLVLVLLLLAVCRAQASTCRDAIGVAEASQAIPSHLLAAIGHVESGRADPLTGVVSPWPWTADINGEGHYYSDKQTAIAAVRAAQARGIQSIDVGCLQINLLQHPDAFASLDQAFDPMANAGYGASFLRQLHDQTGSWPLAAADYHSQTPALGNAYAQLVMRAWPEELRLAGQGEPDPGDSLSFAPTAPRDLAAAAAPSTPGAAVRFAPVRFSPFRFDPGPVRMGGAVPPIGRPVLVAEAGTAPPRGFAAARAGRDLASYRRVPIVPVARRDLL